MNRTAGPVIWIGILSTTCLLLFLFQKILWLVVPFLFGLIFYYLLNPIINRMVLRGLSKDTSIAITAGMFLLLLVFFPLFFVPFINEEIISWKDLLTRYLDGGTALLQKTLLMMEKQFSFLDKADLKENINNRISEFTNTFAEKYLTDIILTLGSWLPSLLLAPILTFFFLRDGQKFKKFLCNAVPNAYFERTVYLLHEIDRTAQSYFQGLLGLIVIDTILLTIGLWFIGVSFPFVLGLIAAIFACIPFIGSILGGIMIVLVAATQFPNNPSVAYGAIIVIIFVRLLDDFIFMPMTIGRSLHMHPLLTILMIFVGGSVGGVAGLMLVLPLLGVIMVIGETLGILIEDERLKVRHEFAKKLKKQNASKDLI